MGLLLFWYVAIGIVVFAVTISKMPVKTAVCMTLLIPVAIMTGAFAATEAQFFLSQWLNLKPNGWVFGIITLSAALFAGYGGAKLVRLMGRLTPRKPYNTQSN